MFVKSVDERKKMYEKIDSYLQNKVPYPYDNRRGEVEYYKRHGMTVPEDLNVGEYHIEVGQTFVDNIYVSTKIGIVLLEMKYVQDDNKIMFYDYKISRYDEQKKHSYMFDYFKPSGEFCDVETELFDDLNRAVIMCEWPS